MPHFKRTPYVSYKLALLAGFVGGMIEIVWLLFLERILPIDLAEIARQTTLSVYAVSQKTAWLIPFGLVIHVGFSLVVGFMFASIVNKAPSVLHKAIFIPLFAIVFLLLIWVVNFTFILPILNPNFIPLLPRTATLLSKILFGCGMGGTLLWAKRYQSLRLSKPDQRFH